MSRMIFSILESKWKVGGLMLILTLLLYGRAYDAGFVTDFTGLFLKMQGQGLSAALDSFGFPSLMPLLNVTYWLLYKFFGISGTTWFLFASLVSATTLTIFFFLATQLLRDFGIVKKGKAELLSFTAILLVLTSPYQVEAMIWKVGLGHLMSVAFFMAALAALVKCLSEDRAGHMIYCNCFLMLSLFCFEWGLVFPIMAGVFCAGYVWLGRLSLRRGVRVVLLSGVPVIIYLLLTKMVLGSWLGHYDTETEMNLELGGMAGTTIKYFLKHLGFIHFFPYEIKEGIYAMATSPVAILILIVVGLLLSFRWWRLRGVGPLKWMLLCCAVLGVTLVSGLHFHALLLSENDRYGSLFIFFVALLLVLLLSSFGKYFNVMIVLYLMLNIFFQQKLVTQWSRSQIVINKLTDSFGNLELQDDDRVLMLNLPENLNGTFMFRDFSGQNPLQDHLTMRGISHTEMDLVAQYNIPYQGQVYTAEWLGNSEVELLLTAKNWGSWWWRNGLGCSSYETAYYTFMPKGKAMEVKLKSGNPYTKVIYFDGDVWQTL